MKYNVKLEIYSEGHPFNKWFNYECDEKKDITELIGCLGLEEKRIGVVIINDAPIIKNKKLEDRDSIRFIGRIYPEYL